MRRRGRYLMILNFILFFIQFINQQWHRSTSKEHTGRMANTGLTNHLCAAKEINKRIHKTLEINYNFPSKVYEKSKVRSMNLNTEKLFCRHVDRPVGTRAKTNTCGAYHCNKLRRVPKKLVHQAHIDNLVNSQRIFKILSLAHSVENLL